MPPMGLSQSDSFDVNAAEAAVSAAAANESSSALGAMLSQMRATTNSAARSSVTYNVWSEWLQVNAD